MNVKLIVSAKKIFPGILASVLVYLKSIANDLKIVCDEFIYVVDNLPENTISTNDVTRILPINC